MSIQIEEGKFYKRADGETVGPVWFRNDHFGIGGCHYTTDGLYAYAGSLPRNKWDEQAGLAGMDLVAEATDPTAPVTDTHAVETVEGPQIADTPEWAKGVEAEAAEETAEQQVQRMVFGEQRFYEPRTEKLDGESVEEKPVWTPRAGDMVEHNTLTNAGRGRVVEVLPDGQARVRWGVYGLCTESVSDFSLAAETPRNLLAEKQPTVSELAAKLGLKDPLGVDPVDIKTTIADEAKRIVSGARRSAYGKPEANFERIARLWQAHFANTGRPEANVTANDISLLMVLMKIGRLAESPQHYDSWVDLIGYGLTGAEVNNVTPPAKSA